MTRIYFTVLTNPDHLAVPAYVMDDELAADIDLISAAVGRRNRAVAQVSETTERRRTGEWVYKITALRPRRGAAAEDAAEVAGSITVVVP